MNRRDPSLRTLQLEFHGELLGRCTAFPRRVRDEVKPAVGRRLQIYRHAYHARLRNALAESFEKTLRHVGEETFSELAAAFARRHPPRDRNLRWYGASFSRWLARAMPERPEVAELASLDWQLRSAFDMADDEVPALPVVTNLAGIDWMRSGCRFTQTLAVRRVRFNAAAIWHALDTGVEPPRTDRLARSAWLLVWRKAGQGHFRTIAADEHALLSRLRRGRSLALVCTELGAASRASIVAALAAACLARWVQDELVIAFPCVEPRNRSYPAP
jgi:hypothetical protein